MRDKKKDIKNHRNTEIADNILETTRIMRPLVQNASMDIASKYMLNLLSEPMDYIVHAVWGIKENGQLDEIQKLIHKKTEAVVSKIYALLGMDNMSASQIFAICSLIRELMISKIAHSIEIAKGIMNQPNEECIQGDPSILSNMEVLGNA